VVRRLSAVLAFAIVVASAGALFAQPSQPSQPSPPDARRAAVAVTVGPRKITVGEVEDRMATVPRFQLAAFGDTPDAIKQKFVNDIVVRDALLAQGAESKKIDQEPLVAYRLQRARSDATLAAVRAQVGPAAAIPMADVQAYFDQNRSRYDAPVRYMLWRILCSSRDDAQAVLDTVKKDPSIAKWTEIAREKSIDKGTYMNHGSLGFVSEDGVSNEQGLRLDPAIVKAAETVKDGELVPQPVAEGEHFAVVWRRGTIGASHRTVDEASGQIRQAIWQERVEAAQKKLLDDLRAKNVKDENPTLLDDVAVPQGDQGDEGPVRSRHRQDATAAPPK
jgi:peptidyl-prolyl cis-trans isomerase C